MAKFIRFSKSVTAIEYGLIAALIAIAIFFIIGRFEDQLVNFFSQIKSALMLR